jgi:signal transduction protein with GAF and PtsI domain
MSGNMFSELIGLMQNDISPNEIYTEVCKMVEKKIPYQSATLYVYNEENELLNQEFLIGPDVVDLITEFDFGGGTGFSGWVIKQKQPIIVSDLPHIQIHRKTQFKSFVSLPLWVGKRLLGVLNFGHPEKGKYLKSEIKSLKILSGEISLIFHHILFQKKLTMLESNIKTLESELQKRDVKLSELKDTAAMGEVVLKIKNKINKPLSSILGLAEILELSIHTLPPKRIKETLHALIIESKKMEKILNRI